MTNNGSFTRKAVSGGYGFPFSGETEKGSNLLVKLGHKRIDVALCGDETEIVTVDNPLFGDGLVGLAERYEADRTGCAARLKDAIDRAASGLLAKRGEIADALALFTCGLYGKILAERGLEEGVADYGALFYSFRFQTAKRTIVPPVYDEYVGSDLLAETVRYPQNTLVVDCDEVLTVMSVEEDTNTVATMWAMQYDEMGLRALRAAVKTLIPTGYIPFVRLMGDYAEHAEETLVELGLNVSFTEKSVENESRIFSDAGFLTKLQKECARTSTFYLLRDERFHEFFTEG